jgi:translocation and assembly module TamB
LSDAPADAPLDIGEPEDAPAPRTRRRWLSLLAKGAISLFLGLTLLVAGVAVLLDTDLGHRLILDRIAAMTPESGLRIRIGRIEGSIWGRTELRDVRLYDPEGLFAEAPRIELEWQPLGWLAGRLMIHEVESDLVIVRRLPRLDDPPGDGLPNDDIHIGRLEIAQLRLEPPVAGARRFARVSGSAEFRSGRALMELDARMRDGGDRLSLLIDAEPQSERFDLDLRLDAPAGGVFARLLAVDEALHATLTGDGSWRSWAGVARLQLGGLPAGALALTAADGRYGARGWLAPGLLPEPLGRLAAPRLLVDADGRFDRATIHGTLNARSPAMRLLASGAIDLRGDLYRDVRLGLRLPGSAQLGGGFTASGATAAVLLDGAFDDASIAYRVTADRLAAGSTALENVRAAGRGRMASGRFAAPVAASVGRVTGAGEGIDALLANLRISGSVAIAGARLAARDLMVAGDRVRARISAEADLDTGRYAFAGEGDGHGLPIEGLGPADVNGTIRGTGGRAGLRLTGSVRARMLRLDSDLVRWVAEGSPRLEATIATAADGRMLLPELRFLSPALRLSGNAARRGDGTVLVEARGRHTRYGPVSFRAEGPLSAPRLALRLSRPSPLFANLALDVEPRSGGFSYRARGSSPLGPFAARGWVALARGRPSAVRIAALDLSGATGAGALRPAGGGFGGRIDFRGALAGPVLLATPGGEQRIEARLVASDARLGDLPIGSGRLDTWAQFGPRGGNLRGRIRFDGAADRLWPLAGLGRVDLSGPFELDAELGGSLTEPDVRGRLELRRARFASAATGTVIERIDADARFAGSRLTVQSFAGRTPGGGRVSGRGSIDFGAGLAVEARIESDEARLIRLPQLSARVSGRVQVNYGPGGGIISGDVQVHEADLRFGDRGREGSAERAASPWRLSLGVRADALDLSGRGLDSRWRGEVSVGGTLATPTLTGEASLIRGHYSLFGVRFELSDGTARFEGESPPDPRIDVLARPPAGLPLPPSRITGRLSEIGRPP